MEDDKRDPFVGLGWDVEIVRLADSHILFNLSLERGVSGTKRFHDDYEITPFSQSTQVYNQLIHTVCR